MIRELRFTSVGDFESPSLVPFGTLQEHLHNAPKLEKLTKQITLIENQLSDMNFYHKEPETYKVCALQVEELKNQLGSKEQKWLELELKREALGEIE